MDDIDNDDLTGDGDEERNDFEKRPTPEQVNTIAAPEGKTTSTGTFVGISLEEL